MSPTGTILVVEDDEAMRLLLEEELKEAGYAVIPAADGGEALELLARARIDLVVTDQRMPGMQGSELLSEVRAREPEIPVVIITAFGSIESAVEAVRAGAFHYVAKPFRMEQLLVTVSSALRERHLRQKIAELRDAASERPGLVAESAAMRKLLDVVRRAADVDTPVLILGETGTGKELLARALHSGGRRSTRRFVPVNCSAIPETLLESQLFGHRRGAFTDAREDRRGLFQEADGGTLLLDEIGDMPLSLQVKLLRALQEREVQPLGAPSPIAVDVRVVASTHRDIESMVASGAFRQDLLYRLNVLTLRVPPLRERPEDFVPLVATFLRKFGPRLGRAEATLSAETLDALRRYAWPGNVRELENCIERALLLSQDGVIRPDALPDAVRGSAAGAPGVPGLKTLTELEREHIARTMKSFKGNKAAAARALGLDRKTLYRKLEQYKIPH